MNICEYFMSIFAVICFRFKNVNGLCSQGNNAIMKSNSRPIQFLWRALVLMLLSGATAQAGEINGFDTSSQVLDENTLVRVGPVDFPTVSLDEIKLESVADTDWKDDDFVLGVALNGEARAYPLAMMVWHQLANDVLGEVPILVTFCRMCGAGIVYDRVVGDKTLSFGMSGLIYRADILLYDRETQSLWSRFLDEAVAGPSAGSPVLGLPNQLETLGEWKSKFPESTIVSRENSYGIDYGSAPMGGSTSADGVFTTLPRELRYHPAMPVVGVQHNGKIKAYPAGEILLEGGTIEDNFEGVSVNLTYTVKDQVFKTNINSSLKHEVTRWHKWAKQFPETEIYKAGDAQL